MVRFGFFGPASRWETTYVWIIVENLQPSWLLCQFRGEKKGSFSTTKHNKWISNKTHRFPWSHEQQLDRNWGQNDVYKLYLSTSRNLRRTYRVYQKRYASHPRNNGNKKPDMPPPKSIQKDFPCGNSSCTDQKNAAVGHATYDRWGWSGLASWFYSVWNSSGRMNPQTEFLGLSTIHVTVAVLWYR